MNGDTEPCRFTLPFAFHKVEGGAKAAVGQAEKSPPTPAEADGDPSPPLRPTPPEEPVALVRLEPPELSGSSGDGQQMVRKAPDGPTVLGGATSNQGGPAHLVLFRQMVDKHSLAFWAARYLATEVAGVQAQNTLEAKSRDLVAFVRWFVGINGIADVGDWMPLDTQAYLNILEVQGRAPATINRVFATLRRFARWAHEQPGSLFGACGLPTRGIKELAVDEPDCQKLERRELHRLFKAADRLVLTETRADQRPRRNRAVLAMLYYTGLRVSELVALKRHQYDGRYLLNVKRKGKARSKGVYVGAECRKALNEYLQTERSLDAAQDQLGALLARKGTSEPLTRQMVGLILTRIAQEANKHQGEEGALQIHPHRLRHTFGAEYRDKTGSDTETATALGHAGLSYVGRYVRKTQQEREEVIDGL